MGVYHVLQPVSVEDLCAGMYHLFKLSHQPYTQCKRVIIKYVGYKYIVVWDIDGKCEVCLSIAPIDGIVPNFYLDPDGDYYG